MEVRPPILDLSAKAGQSTANVFLLTNTEVVAQTFAFTIQGFLPQGETGQQQFLPATQTTGLPSWLYLTQSRVTVEAGQTVPVPILFRAPTGTQPGAYQAVVFASPVDAGTSGVTLGSRVGVLVFATVEGNVSRALRVISFERTSESPSILFHPIFEAILRNEGQAHEIPEGMVRIKNVLGQVVHIMPLQTASVRIIPQSQRLFTIGRNDDRDLGGGWGMGWYHAELVLGEPFLIQADGGWFFVLPWKTLLLILFVIGGSIFLKRSRT